MIGHDGQPNWLRQTALTLLFPIPWAIGCSQNAPPTADVVRPVKTMVVTSGDDMRMRSFPGTVEASKRVELAFQVPGLLVTLPVKEGQKVAKDEVIGQLRQDEFKARLKRCRASSTRPARRWQLCWLANGPRNACGANRKCGPPKPGSPTPALNPSGRRTYSHAAVHRGSKYEADETAYRVAEEDLKPPVSCSKKERSAARKTSRLERPRSAGSKAALSKRTFNSRTRRFARPTTASSPSGSSRKDRMCERRSRSCGFKTSTRSKSSSTCPRRSWPPTSRSRRHRAMLAELSGAPGLQFPVEIREIAQVADPTTQTFKVRAAMQAPDGIRVLPGMTATVDGRPIAGAASWATGSWCRSPPCSRTRTGEQIVWVVGADRQGRRRAGESSATSTGGQIEIAEGLAPGDRIAVAGVTFLARRDEGPRPGRCAREAAPS